MNKPIQTRSRPWIVGLIALTLIAAVATAVAAGNGRFAIPWWTVDGGGGTSTSASNRFAVSGTIGQPDTGYAESSTFALSGGFWPGVPLGTTLYLPTIRRDFCLSFTSPLEIEPNNTIAQANGPLCSGVAITGTPQSDRFDYFKLETSAAGTISVNLTNNTGSGVQLVLLNQAGQTLKQDFEAPFSIQHAGPAGLYYVLVYTESGFNNTPYTLTTTFP